MNTQTVLITGASSGIGYELAKLFSKDNYHLVLVSRDKMTLEKVAGELRGLGALSVISIACDLSIAGNAADLYEQTKQKGLDVDILVNDAGVGEFGFFAETDLEKELAIIQLNIASLVVLTKLFLRDMLLKNEGRILQLASVASYQPTPKLAVYAATKSFVLSFTDSLADELKESKVTITALIPGATDTDFFRKAGMERAKAAQDPVDPAKVAMIGYEALMKGEHHAYGPGVKPIVLISSLLSNEKVAAMAHKQMEEE